MKNGVGRLTKSEKVEVNTMAEIIRNTRFSNGYISPHVAAEALYRRGYKKLGQQAALTSCAKVRREI